MVVELSWTKRVSIQFFRSLRCGRDDLESHSFSAQAMSMGICRVTGYRSCELGVESNKRKGHAVASAPHAATSVHPVRFHRAIVQVEIGRR